MENNIVAVPAREYEELSRDSEKVRILSQAVLDGKEVDAGWLSIICGVQEQRHRVTGEELDRMLAEIHMRQNRQPYAPEYEIKAGSISADTLKAEPVPPPKPIMAKDKDVMTCQEQCMNR